jgi:hypothetical protein
LYNQRIGGNWFKKKTRSKKSRDTVPLNCVFLKIAKGSATIMFINAVSYHHYCIIVKENKYFFLILFLIDWDSTWVGKAAVALNKISQYWCVQSAMSSMSSTLVCCLCLGMPLSVVTMYRQTSKTRLSFITPALEARLEESACRSPKYEVSSHFSGGARKPWTIGACPQANA